MRYGRNRQNDLILAHFGPNLYQKGHSSPRGRILARQNEVILAHLFRQNEAILARGLEFWPTILARGLEYGFFS